MLQMEIHLQTSHHGGRHKRRCVLIWRALNKQAAEAVAAARFTGATRRLRRLAGSQRLPSTAAAKRSVNKGIEPGIYVVKWRPRPCVGSQQRLASTHGLL
jgi:hypothetical protein